MSIGSYTASERQIIYERKKLRQSIKYHRDQIGIITARIKELDERLMEKMLWRVKK